MSRRTLVAEYSRELFDKLSGERVAVRSCELGDLRRIALELCRRNDLAAFLVSLDLPLAQVDLPDEVAEIPLALYLPEMGPYRMVNDRLDRLRGANLRVFFPADRPDNYRACQILSSLGVACGLFFTDAEPEWEALCDLSTYAVFGRSPHAPIEPFQHLVDRYDAAKRNSWGAVWFEDAESALHLSSEGKVALTRGHLLRGEFIAASTAELEGIEEHPAYREHAESWRRFFLDDHVCACCPAWRVCGGDFAGVCDRPEEGCRKFFLELMETAEQEQRQRRSRESRRRLWQP